MRKKKISQKIIESEDTTHKTSYEIVAYFLIYFSTLFYHYSFYYLTGLLIIQKNLQVKNHSPRYIGDNTPIKFKINFNGKYFFNVDPQINKRKLKSWCLAASFIHKPDFFLSFSFTSANNVAHIQIHKALLVLVFGTSLSPIGSCTLF